MTSGQLEMQQTDTRNRGPSINDVTLLQGKINLFLSHIIIITMLWIPLLEWCHKLLFLYSHKLVTVPTELNSKHNAKFLPQGSCFTLTNNVILCNMLPVRNAKLIKTVFKKMFLFIPVQVLKSDCPLCTVKNHALHKVWRITVLYPYITRGHSNVNLNQRVTSFMANP